MPIVTAVFAFCAVELVGIPPFIIFQSKWALVTAGFQSGHIVGVLGVVVLLISAGFTAAYLLKPAVTAFALPIERRAEEKRDPGWQMLTLLFHDGRGDAFADPFGEADRRRAFPSGRIIR